MIRILIFVLVALFALVGCGPHRDTNDATCSVLWSTATEGPWPVAPDTREGTYLHQCIDEGWLAPGPVK